MLIERDGEDFQIDASLIGEMLALKPEEVHPLMRSGRITSICERGEGEDAGRYRLTFFYGSRRVRLDLDGTGHVVKRSSIDFGTPPQADSEPKPER